MSRLPERRWGGPYWIVLVDLVRHAVRTRSVAVPLLVALAVVAAMVVMFGQTLLPYAIYPAL